MLIKSTIRNNLNNKSINFGLSNSFEPYYDNQRFSLLIEETIENNISSPNNVEYIKFSPSGSTTQFEALNYNFNTITYSNTFINTFFTISEINNRSKLYLDSFFIVEVFDRPSLNTGIKLSTNYISVKEFLKQDTPTGGTININNVQSFNLYIPENIIEEDLEVYLIYSFYSAKNGIQYYYYNQEKELDTTEGALFFDVSIDFDSRRYVFETLDKIVITQINNVEFINNVNDNLDNRVLESPNYIDGVIFLSNGQYINRTN